MADAVETNIVKRWYVVHAYSGFESFVMQELTSRIAREGLEEMFGEIIVPSENIVEMRAGAKRKSSRKFFPGYVLVQMAMDEKTWHLVRSTPRVLGFVGGKSEKPTPITDAEANGILQRIQDGKDKPKPKVLFENGEMIRIIDGPFNEFNGSVEEVDYNKSKLRVAVSIFGRSTPVELEFTQIEKV